MVFISLQQQTQALLTLGALMRLLLHRGGGTLRRQLLQAKAIAQTRAWSVGRSLFGGLVWVLLHGKRPVRITGYSSSQMLKPSFGSVGFVAGRRLFSSYHKWELLSSCCAWASLRGGLSCPYAVLSP